MNSRSAQIWPPLISFVLLLVIWQLLASRVTAAFWVLPTPSAIMAEFRSSPGLLWSHLWPTWVESLAGLALATLLGIACALLMDSVRLFKTILYPYLVVSQTVPIIAVAPLIILWFGYGISAKVFVTVVVCFFPIALGLFDGLRQVSVEQIRLLASMGAGRWKIYRLLKIPASLPGLFTGLRLAATYSVMGAVFGEWLGGKAGLGIYLTRSTRTFNTPGVFTAIILIVLSSMLIVGLIVLLERIFLGWHFKKAEEYEDRLTR